MDLEFKLSVRSYIYSGNKYAGYIAFAFPPNRMEEFEDYSITQVYDLEIEFRKNQNLPYRSGKTNKNGKTHEYPGRISYFYTWKEGIVQIGFITDSEENAIQRGKELKKMLEYGGFQVCPNDLKITYKIDN